MDKPGTLGVRVGMSRLVANMLESLLYLWRLKTSPEHVSLTVVDYVIGSHGKLLKSGH